MGISFEELIVLAVLAFILFGPEKLPEYAQKLGRLVAKVRQASSELSQQVQNPLQTLGPPPTLSGPEAICPHCLQKISQQFTFCPHCGHRRGPAPDYPPPPSTP